MNIINITAAGILALFTSAAAAQAYSTEQQESWLEKAEQCKPRLDTTTYRPVAIVDIIKDDKSFQGYKAVKISDTDDIYSKSFKQMNEVTLDFGRHLVGQVSFKLKDLGSMQDAILRFKVTFGEVPADLALPREPFTGSLSRGWLQDFFCDVGYDGSFTFSRRISARYMKIEAVGTSQYSDFCFDDITFKATTSATPSKARLAATTPRIFREIAKVSENTLRDCMQGVFEDGPKRDQRLWLGDLYLQALANTATFNDYDLTKRCLYLAAGLANPSNGLLYSNLVEYPSPHAQNSFFVDYALLYVPTLADYLDATNDTTTANDLWPVAKRQVDAVIDNALNADWLYNDTGYQFDGMAMSTVFFDWSPVKLDTHAAIQGCLAYSVERLCLMGRKLGKDDEASRYETILRRLRRAGRDAYWNEKELRITSGPDRQASYSATAWAIIGGIIKGNEARQAINAVMADKSAIKPGTPYATHFVVTAMLKCGMNDEARSYVDYYWGGMVRLGADTFWEYYVPDNHMFSAYNGYTLLNSYCHAWSCTPVYFIVKYPEVFQYHQTR